MYSLILSLSMMLSSPQTLSPENATIPVAVNLAGKQKMLLQRMTKAYMYLYANVQMDAARSEMNSSVVLFEENFKVIKDDINDKRIDVALARINSLWPKYKSTITAKASAENAKELLKGNSELLESCQDLVAVLETIASENGKKTGDLAKIISRAGNQRMLCQRIALYYCAYAQGLDDYNSYSVLQNSIRIFESDLKTLYTYPGNTLEVDDALSKVVPLRDEIVKMKDNIEFGEFNLNKMYTTTSLLTREMDIITSIYAGL